MLQRGPAKIAPIFAEFAGVTAKISSAKSPWYGGQSPARVIMPIPYRKGAKPARQRELRRQWDNGQLGEYPGMKWGFAPLCMGGRGLKIGASLS